MVLSLPPDYHVHTERCGHARGAAWEYVTAAREKGLEGIGISDHLPLLHTTTPDPVLAMSRDELPEYVDEVIELKERYPGYVLLGIEADFNPDIAGETADLLAAYPFDYAIGSIHYLEGWGFDDPRYADEFDSRDVNAVYREYLELVGRAADSGLFDVMGHLDLVKKFGHRATNDLAPEWERLAQRLADAGVAVEINTAGLRKPVGEMYPAAEVLELLAGAGVPLVFGSDAHSPEDVGRDFPNALELARRCGYREYVTFLSNREGRAAKRRRPFPDTT